MLSAVWRALSGTFFARYDDAALLPCRLEDPSGPLWPALKNWCVSGVAQPGLRWAVHAGQDADGAARRAAQVCLELDGSLQLLACGSGAARLRLKLAVKLNDAMPWRARRESDIWDSGFARPGAEARRALMNFQPRRPTLIVLTATALDAELRSALQARSPVFAQALHILVLGAPGLAAPEGALVLPP